MKSNRQFKYETVLNRRGPLIPGKCEVDVASDQRRHPQEGDCVFSVDPDLVVSVDMPTCRSDEGTAFTQPAKSGAIQRGLAAFLLVLSFPLLVIIAFAVLVAAGRPVFFKQKRFGIRGNAFVLLKFRTMIMNAPAVPPDNAASPPYIRVNRDPRIFPVGQFLRRYYLDELPQLLNIIMGDMHLIGRRPLPVEQLTAEQLSCEQIQAWLQVPPGISGPWQSTPNRHCLQFKEVIQMDLDYYNRRTVLKDIRIVYRTIVAIVLGSG